MKSFCLFFLLLLISTSLFPQVPIHSTEIIVRTAESPDSAMFSGGSILLARGYNMRQISEDNWVITTTPREMGKGHQLQVRLSVEKRDSTEIHLSGLILFFQGSHSIIRNIDYQGKNASFPEAWNELYSIAKDIHGGSLTFSKLKKH